VVDKHRQPPLEQPTPPSVGWKSGLDKKKNRIISYSRRMSHARANPQLGHSLKDKLATRVADGSADLDPEPDPPPSKPKSPNSNQKKPHGNPFSSSSSWLSFWSPACVL